MPTISEVIKFEKSTPERIIRLIKSGDFLRAYNHSAWLFSQFVTQYKVTRKFVKQINEDIYFIGFPAGKMHETLGDRKTESTELGYDVLLHETEQPDETKYTEWLSSIVTEPASAADHNSLPLTGVEAEREVLRRLREFRMEKATMVDCVVFLAQLREMLAQK